MYRIKCDKPNEFPEETQIVTKIIPGLYDQSNGAGESIRGKYRQTIECHWKRIQVVEIS
jgi:hypothetical protein